MSACASKSCPNFSRLPTPPLRSPTAPAPTLSLLLLASLLPQHSLPVARQADAHEEEGQVEESAHGLQSKAIEETATHEDRVAVGGRERFNLADGDLEGGLPVLEVQLEHNREAEGWPQSKERTKLHQCTILPASASHGTALRVDTTKHKKGGQTNVAIGMLAGRRSTSATAYSHVWRRERSQRRITPWQFL